MGGIIDWTICLILCHNNKYSGINHQEKQLGALYWLLGELGGLAVKISTYYQ
jgi:hypothetical protein